MQSSGDTENNYLYRGEQYDSHLGMQYLRARYYDPSTGRLASVDPFEGSLEMPISRHRYLYGNDNPITYVDPSGRITSLAGQIATITTLNTLQINIGLAGLGILGLGQRVGGFIARGDGKITWNGIFGGIAANIGPVYAVGGFPATLTSENLGYGPAGEEGRLTGNWLIIAGGASLGPIPLGISAGTATIKSPSQLGVNVGVLSGGFILGSIAASTFAFGGSGSVITMGFGQGYGFGFFFGYDTSGTKGKT